MLIPTKSSPQISNIQEDAARTNDDISIFSLPYRLVLLIVTTPDGVSLVSVDPPYAAEPFVGPKVISDAVTATTL